MRNLTSKITSLPGLSKPLRNERGMALMLAIACIMVITYIAMEVIYDSRVEYEVNSQNLNRIKAYYAAKSGLQLSLLRIKIYQQVQSQYGSMLGSNASMLDQIWKFPLAWPLPIPDELNAVDKDAFKKMAKESTMDASYSATITDEGSKIDLNDLVSPSKTLQEVTKKQLLNVFEQKKTEDEAFAREYSNTRFEELINSITDWMSAKSQSANGGDKRAAYGEMNAESQSDYYPPNRPFRTVAELHMVPGMTDAFYDLLAPRITLAGMKGINPNLATKEVLKSLDPGMTEEAVNAAIKRRDDKDEGGPFKCENGTSQDFWDFVQQRGVRLVGNPQDIPLTCDGVMNFRIESYGQYTDRAVRKITVIVADLNKAATKIKEATDKDKNQGNPGGGNPGGGKSGGNSGNNNQKKEELAKGPPRIIYWAEE
ncbi:general secretion pathway protein GspK [Bdellovibrio sp. HCB2-146]|uniref:general secretion pathway protein GspK n=1 Tax=Bdellovibrio sp. HCB2-146 TaxID=3394362 RepID=UPI0039BD19AF